MKTYSEPRFYDWVNRMYQECKRVTGICAEAVETLNDKSIGCFRELPYGYMEFTDTLKNKGVDTFRKNDYIITFRSDFKIINLKNGKCGWSRMPYFTPKFDGKVALAVAWARYCKCEVPKVETVKRIVDFSKVKSGTEIFFSGKSEFRTVKFISIDPDDCSAIILKVTYDTGETRFVTWYTNTRPLGYFYMRGDK